MELISSFLRFDSGDLTLAPLDIDVYTAMSEQTSSSIFVPLRLSERSLVSRPEERKFLKESMSRMLFSKLM